MGRAMKNLDKLLAMPYGCGEQNMVLFAPNIFILNYLKSTGQLTPDVQEKATLFLESGKCSDAIFKRRRRPVCDLLFAPPTSIPTAVLVGYQRELTYKHDDGSYSAFGKSDESGNTWWVKAPPRSPPGTLKRSDCVSGASVASAFRNLLLTFLASVSPSV